MVNANARLVGLDWGSTSLRAFLLGPGGVLIEERSAKQGSTAMNGSAAAYESTLAQIAGDWLAAAPALPVLACGMVGSKHGWREAPYAACPAGEQQLAGGFVRVTAAGREIAIVPGMSCRTVGSAPDVMRGEETQIVGALAQRPDLAGACTFVLPGTHSKWAHVRENQVIDFATYMTGELFAVLRGHSVLGRLMIDQDEPDDDSFAAGVRAAAERTALAHQLFAVRTLGLFDELKPEALPDYLSGLLIGHEITAGLRERYIAGGEEQPLVLVGEPKLCALYESALHIFGSGVEASFPNTAPAGLWRLALEAGIVTGTEESGT
ncbi:2-dehydro-3-deoxygalactonokinase [Massilia horti]|uniref:2-dehydro-3-deoxygalactonokinase n=1 Tax=Massilia horti TaxID=2562153 RepID=A0A4Y9T3T7_9BURK|nr:2-dehydro-3-deoxygalactonokinase [Massilia horti]TFW34909.1 2-dehydro-3-deoxygalactonokinase [Massilia horti]